MAEYIHHTDTAPPGMCEYRKTSVRHYQCMVYCAGHIDLTQQALLSGVNQVGCSNLFSTGRFFRIHLCRVTVVCCMIRFRHILRFGWSCSHWTLQQTSGQQKRPIYGDGKTMTGVDPDYFRHDPVRLRVHHGDRVCASQRHINFGSGPYAQWHSSQQAQQCCLSALCTFHIVHHLSELSCV